MTALALDLLQAVTTAGGAIRLEGGMLRLSAPAPLPEDLRVRVRECKAEIVALLAAEHAIDPAAKAPAAGSFAGLPQEVTDGVRDILSADGAQGIPSQHWGRVRRDTERLVERGWARQSLTLGWTAADLFGCDQRTPWHRLDRAGLVLLIGGHEIVELTAHDAALRTRTGSVLRYRRRPPVRPPVILLWDLLIPSQATGPPIRGPTAHPDEERMAAEVLGGTPPPS